MVNLAGVECDVTIVERSMATSKYSKGNMALTKANMVLTEGRMKWRYIRNGKTKH